MPNKILSIENLWKSYPSRQGSGAPPLEILKGLELDIKEGETVAIVGKSGSGKSTFLSLVAGLDSAQKGQVFLKGVDLLSLPESELVRYRASHMGIVFQQFHLMPHLNAMENVMLPLELLGIHDSSKVEKVLTTVGLWERRDHLPSELSGGECQRLAIARALVIQPAIVLADEPTGSLDEVTAKRVEEALFQAVEQEGTTLLLVTHNLELAGRCEKVYQLQEGRLHEMVENRAS